MIETVVGQVGELKLGHVNEPSLDRCFKAALQNGVYVLTNIKDAKSYLSPAQTMLFLVKVLNYFLSGGTAELNRASSFFPPKFCAICFGV